MYLVIAFGMVFAAVALVTAGLLGAYLQCARKAFDDAVEESDSGQCGNASSEDEATEQEVKHLLFWDPFTHEPVDENTAAIVHMTVLMPDGSEPQISIAVNPTTADRYLSKDGGPQAFKDSILELEGSPGWCLVANLGGTVQPTSLGALYGIIVGQMVESGDSDGWFQTLQAYWEFDAGYGDDLYLKDEVTKKTDMRMAHPELDGSSIE